MYGGFHDKDKLILLSEKMQVCISQIKCNDCAVGVMHLLWLLGYVRLPLYSWHVQIDNSVYPNYNNKMIFYAYY